MHKIGWILILIFLTGTGCSSVKRSARTITSQNEGARLSDISWDIQKLNIIGNDFFIQKAEIEVYNNNEKQKLLGSVKYKNSGEYLVSLRSRSGIEAARFYLSEDTILINDRVNRKLYYGSPEYLERKYGITASFLPVLLGDFKDDSEMTKIDTKCINGQLEVEKKFRNNNMIFIIDCNLLKVKKIIIENEGSSAGINLTFDKFFKNEGLKFPERIKIEDLLNGSMIKIYVDKIEIPWEGIIEFVPGRNYKVVKLQ